jgi:hypothetical protein
MREVILAFACGVALIVTSAQAAPLPPNVSGPAIYISNQEWAPLTNDPHSRAAVGAAPAIELVAQGCGWGRHRHHWRGRWGYWHWGRCVPNGW